MSTIIGNIVLIQIMSGSDVVRLFYLIYILMKVKMFQSLTMRVVTGQKSDLVDIWLKEKCAVLFKLIRKVIFLCKTRLR